MREETAKILIRIYEENKGKRLKYITDKKKNIQTNNFLFLPTEDHLDTLSKVHNLQEKHLKILKGIAERSITNLKPHIEELANILCLKDYDTDWDEIGFLQIFSQINLSMIW